MTLDDWNKSPIYRDEWNRFLETPTGRALMEVHQSSTPRTPRLHGLDATFLIAEHGRVEGHLSSADLLFKTLTSEPSQQAEIKPDYAPENNE